MTRKPIEDMTSAELNAEFAHLLHRLSDDQLEDVAQRGRDLAAKHGKPEGNIA